MTCCISPNFSFLLIFVAIASIYADITKGDQDLHPQAFFHNPNVHHIDVRISSGVGARLYTPSLANPSEKLPLIVYYHGGGFDVGSTFFPPYDDFLQSLVAHTNVIALSVEYRLAIFFPLPIAYDDSWSALQWIASHSNGTGPKKLLNRQVDFGRVYLAGDSAGGNIAHNMVMRIASEKIKGLRIKGIALLCPYFWGSIPIDLETWDIGVRLHIASSWLFSTRGFIGIDDFRINPLLDPRLSTLASNRVLVIVGHLDILKYRGIHYARALQTNGYKGKVELMIIGGWHDFFLNIPKAIHLYTVLGRLSSFFKET